MKNPKDFCICTDTKCPCHPVNHDQGCNLCIMKNLSQKEIPSCFFHDIDHLKPTKGWYYEDFAALVNSVNRDKYHFFGAATATVHPIDETYNSIRDPRVLYDLLSDIWCKRTCAPRMQDEWTSENKTLGQCSITAFLVQDIFGGKVYGILRPGGNYHCYNVVDGYTFDLTSEQFQGEKLTYEGNPEQFREDHFSKKEKYERYLYLKSELDKKISGI